VTPTVAPTSKATAPYNAIECNAHQGDPLECAVTSYAAIKLNLQEAQQHKKQSDALPGNLGNTVLRHADEQTLTALIAMKKAIDRFESVPEQFGDWGIVASSRYLGRSAFAQALNKFAAEGPWNVSVQVVPNRSLHSPASMIGLALGCHGPCIGVGGGRDGEPDAWLTAMSLLDQKLVAGMWVVFTGWEPDEEIDTQGTPLTDSNCTALVLALQSSEANAGSARLKIAYDGAAPVALPVPAPMTSFMHFENFMKAASTSGNWTIPLGGGLCARIEHEAVGQATIPLPTSSVDVQRKAA
jgi:hypothetical protein